LLAKAIVDPSGDHAGSRSVPKEAPSDLTEEVERSTMKIRLEPSLRALTNAISLPVGDQVGSVSETGGS